MLTTYLMTQVMYTQCCVCSALCYITYNALCISADSEYNTACVRGKTRPDQDKTNPYHECQIRWGQVRPGQVKRDEADVHNTYAYTLHP
jgi:hypothetical protein